MYKSNVGDYPLKDYPCKYWWVRYSVSCTYLKQQFEKMWEPKLKELKEKHGFIHFSYRGLFNTRDIRDIESSKRFLNSKIFILLKDKTEKELNPIKDKEIWDVLHMFIQESEEIGWFECPYQNDKQSKCPFYVLNEHYSNIPLEELRTRKGYEL